MVKHVPEKSRLPAAGVPTAAAVYQVRTRSHVASTGHPKTRPMYTRGKRTTGQFPMFGTSPRNLSDHLTPRSDVWLGEQEAGLETPREFFVCAVAAFGRPRSRSSLLPGLQQPHNMEKTLRLCPVSASGCAGCRSNETVLPPKERMRCASSSLRRSLGSVDMFKSSDIQERDVERLCRFSSMANFAPDWNQWLPKSFLFAPLRMATFSGDLSMPRFRARSMTSAFLWRHTRSLRPGLWLILSDVASTNALWFSMLSWLATTKQRWIRWGSFTVLLGVESFGFGFGFARGTTTLSPLDCAMVACCINFWWASHSFKDRSSNFWSSFFCSMDSLSMPGKRLQMTSMSWSAMRRRKSFMMCLSL
mmetsp:Transcript_5465/g.15658  ORF Transcript_5465/g.15658 Transcript_5465/m.15658 type:complete len:361 (+) Transcript_5465:27-1109(+)